jgi:hypothetical protein
MITLVKLARLKNVCDAGLHSIAYGDLLVDPILEDLKPPPPDIL